jgi:tetratricopeptide (TPR) repeat protein
MKTKLTLYKYFPLLILGCFLSTSALALPAGIKAAVQAFDQGELEKAQTMIDEVVSDVKYQKQANSWYYRGVIYDQLMRIHITSDAAATYRDEAIQFYQKTLMLSNQDSQYHSFAQINLQALWTYYINRGVQYYKMEAFEEALEQLSIARQIDPQAPLTILYTAIIDQQAEQYEEACRGYEQYQALGYQDVAVYRALANLAIHHLKDSSQAQTILQAALQKYPWDVSLLEEYDELLATHHQLEEKQSQLQSQLLATPRQPIHYYQLGYLYDKTNQYEQALECYQQALALAPRQLEIIVQLAILHYNQGARALSNIIELPEEAFQQTGQTGIEQAHHCLQQSVIYWEKARRLSPKNLYILQQLRTLYKRLNNEKKTKAITQQMKRMKGGSQLIEAE